MTIDRYYPDADSFGNYHGMERAKFGEYVLYNEHAEKLLVLSRQEHETANRLDNATTRIDELATEVAKYKDALNDIRALVESGYFVDAAHLGDIARFALRNDS